MDFLRLVGGERDVGRSWLEMDLLGKLEDFTSGGSPSAFWLIRVVLDAVVVLTKTKQTSKAYINTSELLGWNLWESWVNLNKESGVPRGDVDGKSTT